jgi:NitT/TauT family transport system substrate-binding protein
MNSTSLYRHEEGSARDTRGNHMESGQVEMESGTTTGREKDMEENIEAIQAEERTEDLNRRDFLKYSVAAGVSVPLLGGVTRAASAVVSSRAVASSSRLQTVRWISPRGSLAVPDDYDLHVAIAMGYFRQFDIKCELIAGPLSDALATTTFVAAGKADMGYPSPGVLTASIATGVPVKGIWDMMSGQVFDFGLPLNSPIKSFKELAGKTIALGSEGWTTIVGPILAGAGVDPKSVTYVEAGAEWAQATERGQADACLTWEGLRAQWAFEGIKLKYLLGTKFSTQPSNVYAVRDADLKDPAKVDLYTNFLTAMTMAFEFTRANPRAGCMITYDALPALQKAMTPVEVYADFLQVARMYGQSSRAGKPWGWAYLDNWEKYLRIVHNIGQTKTLLKVDDVVTNSLVVRANAKANRAKAVADAKAFKLSKTWQAAAIAKETYPI